MIGSSCFIQTKPDWATLGWVLSGKALKTYKAQSVAVQAEWSNTNLECTGKAQLELYLAAETEKNEVLLVH